MRWYLNDISLQGQFNNISDFFPLLTSLIELRSQSAALRSSLYVTRTLATREIRTGVLLGELLQQREYRELRAMILFWLDRKGPFIEDDRQPEQDDYFEFEGLDVTETGLGEAARQVKSDRQVTTFSFTNGPVNFSRSPLEIEHGIEGDRLGQYCVKNIWTIDSLRAAVHESAAPPKNWRELVELARIRYSHLIIPDSIHANNSLSRESFDSIICNRALELLDHLNEYMKGRNPDGSEGSVSTKIIQDYFTGDRAPFSGESETNKNHFKHQLTFPDPSDLGSSIFCHWHGKISHRFFRLHFEWPVSEGKKTLNVVYLGPKITKS